MIQFFALLAASSLTFPGADPIPRQPPAETDNALLRTVDGQTLTSPKLPAAKMTFDKDFKYIGGQSFILYGVARAEQHFFVDADEQNRIKRFYWVQFEGYLPDNKHTYRYKSTATAKMGGREFIADAMPKNIKFNLGRSDSDSSRAQAFLKKKGYTMASDNVINQRLVHLLDPEKRNELMIIYSEDLTPMKLTAGDLGPKGRAADQWEKIAAGLLERATKGIEWSK